MVCFHFLWIASVQQSMSERLGCLVCDWNFALTCLNQGHCPRSGAVTPYIQYSSMAYDIMQQCILDFVFYCLSSILLAGNQEHHYTSTVYICSDTLKKTNRRSLSAKIKPKWSVLKHKCQYGTLSSTQSPVSEGRQVDRQIKQGASHWS